MKLIDATIKVIPFFVFGLFWLIFRKENAMRNAKSSLNMLNFDKNKHDINYLTTFFAIAGITTILFGIYVLIQLLFSPGSVMDIP